MGHLGDDGRILESAKKQLMTMNHDDITLATIAETTSVSRPTMYRYYEKKELVFIDLLVQEYVEFEQELRIFLKRKLARETFCKKLAAMLWKHQVLLKLLSLQLPIWKREYDAQMLEDRQIFDSIPGGEENCFAGLMLLSTGLDG